MYGNNWGITNEIYNLLRSSKDGVYAARLADTSGYSPRTIVESLTPLVAANILLSERKMVATKSGNRVCRIFKINKYVHKRTTMNFLLFEQIKAAPGKTYEELRDSIGAKGIETREGLYNLHRQGLIKIDGSPRRIVYKTIRGRGIYPVGLR